MVILHKLKISQRHVSLAFHYSAIWALNCLCQNTVNLKGILTIFFFLVFMSNSRDGSGETAHKSCLNCSYTGDKYHSTRISCARSHSFLQEVCKHSCKSICFPVKQDD